MPRDDTRTLHLKDADATRDLARRLAHQLREGNVVTLSGPIGAGKSDMARAIIRARAGRDIEVPSPTFTIVQDYDLPDIRILHADLYRLSDPSELPELGLDELSRDHLLLIEWPDRAGGMFGDPDLAISLSLAGRGRDVKLSGPLTAHFTDLLSDHV